MSTRLRINGHASPEEAVAVLLALDAAARADAGEEPSDQPPGWVRAARLEGLGHPPIAAPSDLRAR